MEQIINKIESSLNVANKNLFPCCVSNNVTPMADYFEQKTAFYTGMISGYKIAMSILAAVKGVIKSIRIIKSKIVTERDYSYVTYLRSLATLRNILKNTECRIQCNNPIQAKKLEGQVLAIQEVINNLNDDFRSNVKY